jgi:hypothetical protein
LAVALILLGGVNLFAEIDDAVDTVLVPYNYVDNSGNTTGALNQFIADDKEDGIPAGRVYLLERGRYYLLSGTIVVDTFKLRIVGQEGPEDVQPAVVSAGLKEDGTGVWQFFKSSKDVEFKNVYFKGATPTEIQTGECVRFIAENTTLKVDNCVFDAFHFVTFHFFKVGGGSAYITNSYFRNLNHKDGGKYNGRALRFLQADADTIVMQNNTFANSNSFFLDMNRFGQANYALIDHNTIVNTVKFVFQWHHQTNAVVTNNLFYNGHSYGETASDRANQDPDGMIFGIFGIDTINTDMTGEAERNVLLANNCWYYDDAVKAYWNSRDTVDGEPFLNSRSQAMFDDDATWPRLVEQDNINQSVNFAVFTSSARDSMVKFMEGDRDGTEKPILWGNHLGGNVYNILWPLYGNESEDFSYAETDPAYTAGTDGYPIGDLNWFPDKKDQWLAIEDGAEDAGVVKNFRLHQNYPNPFNPSTEISFDLNRAGRVRIAVYNILGQKVATLLDRNMQVGAHHVNWNGLDAGNRPVSSGTYFYRMEFDGISTVRKMVLLK